MQRNYLKGFIGDEINLLLAASAFNLKKWMNNFLVVIFTVKLLAVVSLLSHIRQEKRHKYVDLYLTVYRLW
jgi:IS5 family transposase